MRCPWPAIRLARALRDGAQMVEIAADDPRAAGELASAATAVGARLDVVGEGVFRVAR
ncbi:sulfurtransferase TusA family protein [Sphingomonas hankookensis]|nr:sulfurtransferase TusA family protein [Sphingomonas hankookensis]PZT92915.1 MAG: sulfurtransferase TusA family protein [Sphingomonas sp.]RSV31898.1 sulfurtransferase TusA family protein [Sphingomonas sp. ABOLH]WCP73673.1 sulfurtransferase TusA family protein [Sphingomonas hankookensis]